MKIVQACKTAGSRIVYLDEGVWAYKTINEISFGYLAGGYDDLHEEREICWAKKARAVDGVSLAIIGMNHADSFRRKLEYPGKFYLSYAPYFGRIIFGGSPVKSETYNLPSFQPRQVAPITA